MKRLRRVVDAAVAVLRAQPKTFVLLFGVLALVTLWFQARAPLGPGRDVHVHVMVAALNARPFDGAVRALYRFINPFDAGTLLYTFAFPFEVVASPVRAFQLAVTTLYFLGLPLACAVALTRVGRSPWGALLAFPAAYGPAACEAGAMTFVSAAPFFVLALAEFHVAHAATGARARNAAGLCAFFCVLTFLGHAHVYLWLATLLSALTVLFLLREAARVPLDPRLAAVMTMRVALTSLLLVGPSLLAFGRWYVATHFGARAVSPNPSWTPSELTWALKTTSSIGLLWLTKGESEARYSVGLGLVVVTCLAFSRRPLTRSSGVGLDLCFLVTALSVFLAPVDYHGQPISRRHVDMALWLLPLAVFDTLPRRRRLAESAAIIALFGFAVARVAYVGRYLKRLDDEDYGGLRFVAEECKRSVPRGTRPTLAYAARDEESRHWRAASLHHAQATLAAICGLDAPIYDPKVYPNNLLPLRYRRGLPAPVTNVSRERPNDRLFDTFEYVLVQGWSIPRPDTDGALHADLVAKGGDFQLWRRRR